MVEAFLGWLVITILLTAPIMYAWLNGAPAPKGAWVRDRDGDLVRVMFRNLHEKVTQTKFIFTLKK
jgi:hypothetical protein